MIRPKSQTAHKALLNAEMLEEYSILSRQAPTFGKVAPEGYKERAQAYNAKCKELGATSMMVVEG